MPQIIRIRRQRRLHAHLDRLKRTQGNVRQELGRRRRAQVHKRLVDAREQLLAVPVLEDLVEAVLARALERVADKRRRPAEEDAAQALGAEDLAPGLQVGLVQRWVYLAACFHLLRLAVGFWLVTVARLSLG